MNESDFRQSLHEHLATFFADQAQGLDIPPAILYRLEGRIALGIELGLTSVAKVRQTVATLAAEHLGTEAARCYSDVAGDEPVVLHLHMAEAPVFPSTGKP